MQIYFIPYKVGEISTSFLKKLYSEAILSSLSMKNAYLLTNCKMNSISSFGSQGFSLVSHDI